jgi:heptosyltransferase-2
MSMPALQAFREAQPEAHLVLLAKRRVAALWRMHPVPDRILILEPGLKGTLRCAGSVREGRFTSAYVLPHSFRSALVTCLGRVPRRVGGPGHFRSALLTRVVRPDPDPRHLHQAYEYLDVLVPGTRKPALRNPAITVPDKRVRTVLGRLDGRARPWIGLIPGAARGPSKQWPPGHFAETGRQLHEQAGGTLLVFGIESEQELCGDVADGIGPAAMNLAGQFGLEEWAAALKLCDVVVANDSGGMHVAAAVGTPVVGLYGTTDPEKTGPLGARTRILQKPGPRSRDVKSDSEEARARLKAIGPEEVREAVMELLGEQAGLGQG